MKKNKLNILVIGNYHLSYVYSSCLSDICSTDYFNSDNLSKSRIYKEIKDLREPRHLYPAATNMMPTEEESTLTNFNSC